MTGRISYLSLEDYLDSAKEKWFLTGKRKYSIQAMMVSAEISFRNDYEVTDYTVSGDRDTVVLKGTRGEMWTTSLSKVIKNYTKPDGSALSADDFAVRDTFIDLVTVSLPDSNFAMHVPLGVSVTVKTSGGNVLHTNLPNAPHGEGDYLVCKAGKDGSPDLSSVWVLNGALFADCYDTSRMNVCRPVTTG